MSNVHPNHLNTLQFSFEVQGVADGVHVAEDGGVEDAGVAFGHLDAGVTEHTRDVLQAHSQREAESRVGVAGSVHRQVLVDFADSGYLFQIAVHHLIAGDWKQHAFPCGFLVALIFLDDGEGDVKQRDVRKAPALSMFLLIISSQRKQNKKQASCIISAL